MSSLGRLSPISLSMAGWVLGPAIFTKACTSVGSDRHRHTLLGALWAQVSDPEDPNAGNVREWVLNSPHTQRQAVWILAGGDSVERQASLAAGQHVLQQLLMQPDIQVRFSSWLPTSAPAMAWGCHLPSPRPDLVQLEF